MHLQPGVQRLGPRLRPLLAYSSSRVGVEVAHLFLDLVQPPEQLQRLLGDLALVVGPQVVELATRVREAAGFGDAVVEQLLVAAGSEAASATNGAALRVDGGVVRSAF